MNKNNPHYTILKALYDLYEENKGNKAILDKVSAISWTLEHDLNFERHGYFELSELINYGDDTHAADHYVQVIESSLQKLKNEDWGVSPRPSNHHDQKILEKSQRITLAGLFKLLISCSEPNYKWTLICGGLLLYYNGMFSHEPQNYDCPFCALLAGKEDDYGQASDIVYQNEYATALIAPKWWVNNPGSVLIIPNKHYENIYDLPDKVLAEVYKVVKDISIAVRSTYDCDGTSNRQHNEPAGNQAVGHLHVHVFPRYENDKLYQNHDNKRFVTAAERAPYAEKLRKFLAEYSRKD